MPTYSIEDIAINGLPEHFTFKPIKNDELDENDAKFLSKIMDMTADNPNEALLPSQFNVILP